MGVAIGDVNNDGWPDVLVTQYGGVRLFLNNGDGTLHRRHRGGRPGQLALGHVGRLRRLRPRRLARPGRRQLRRLRPRPAVSGTARPARITVAPSRSPGPSPSCSTTWAGAAAAAGRVRFEDVTVASGLGRLPGPGLGVVCADFDGDGWPDIFVANDGQPNRLWINQHDGTFKEEAVARGVAYNGMGQAQANMGVALGDVDGDGLFDLFVTHLTEETNTLWKQGPRGHVPRPDGRRRAWRTRAGAAPASARSWPTSTTTAPSTWPSSTAGSSAPAVGARPGLGPLLGPLRRAQPAVRQRRRPAVSATFRRTTAPFCGTPGVSRGLACGDVDGDGALDLLVTTVAGPARLYRNVAPDRGHWLLVRAVDPALHRDAYGAEVTVEAGDRRCGRWINPGTSYLCSNDPRAHFGLGPAGR